MNPPFGQPWSKDKIGEEQYKKIIAENTKAGESILQVTTSWGYANVVLAANYQ